MEYLVMETFNTYAVLLDSEGRFVKTANPGYEIGETVTTPVIMRDKPLEKVSGLSKINKRVVASIVAIAAMVALFFGVNFYQQNYAPYTSIFMMINPEVEMVLNRNGEVIDLEGANADGEILLEGYEQNSKDKTVILNELVDRAVEQGFLAEGGQVSISIDTPDQALFEEYGIELRRELDGRTRITIQITDLESKGNIPASPIPPADDSGYDDTDYDTPDDNSDSDEPVKSQPKPKEPASRDESNDDDTDYDDTDYDDTNYDDSDYDDSAYEDTDYDD